MTLKAIESIGELVCDVVSFIKKEFGMSNSIIDKVDTLCEKIIPDLEKLIESDDACKFAEKTLDIAQRIKKTLG